MLKFLKAATWVLLCWSVLAIIVLLLDIFVLKGIPIRKDLENLAWWFLNLGLAHYCLKKIKEN